MGAAAAGNVTMTLNDPAGDILVTVTVSYDPETLSFEDPAVTVANSASEAVPAVIHPPNAAPIRTQIPAGRTDFTRAQLATFGISSFADLAGVSISSP